MKKHQNMTYHKRKVRIDLVVCDFNCLVTMKAKNKHFPKVWTITWIKVMDLNEIEVQCVTQQNESLD